MSEKDTTLFLCPVVRSIRQFPKKAVTFAEGRTKFSQMEIYKIIKVNHGMRKKMMEIFSTTYPTLRAALSFETNTDKAEQIRSYALEHGGILLESPFAFK